MLTPRLPSSEASLHFDLVIPSLIVPNHKQMMRIIASEIAQVIGINDRILGERLSDKEKETPSAMGDGLAITHLQLSGLQNSLNVFIKLKNPVAMSAPDNKDVDIVCILLTPEREGSMYLRTLARVSRLLRNPQICARLRASTDEKSIRNILEQSSSNSLAA